MANAGHKSNPIKFSKQSKVSNQCPERRRLKVDRLSLTSCSKYRIPSSEIRK